MIEKVIVDADFPFSVFGINEGYAYTFVNGIREYIHRIVAGAKAGERVDHINRNKLDNRKENLRIVNASQNGANSRRKGYSFHKASGKWRARVMKDYKEHTRYFSTEEEAREGYEKLHAELHGEFSPYYKGVV